MLSTLTEVGIPCTMKEIKNMTKKIVKQKCKEAAYLYLKQKQENGSKGAKVVYSGLQMAEYLLPQTNISIEDQRELFAIRCRTNDLGANRGIIENCECGELLNNSHIFKCKNLNEDINKYDIKYILNGYTEEKKEHLKIWRLNMKRREEILRTRLL